MTATSQKKPPKPWSIHFFQRDKSDDSERAVPAIEFLDSIPAKVAAEIQAVLDAVAAAPPPSFSGGGKWEAMHDDMAGFFEVRVQAAERTTGCSASSYETPTTWAGRASCVLLVSRSRRALPRTRVTTAGSSATAPSSGRGGPFSSR